MSGYSVRATVGSRLIFEAIKKAGITAVASLPEQKLYQLIELVDRDNALRHVPLCREEEGVAICAGTYLAGKLAMIMQNGGLLNSVNGLTSTALHLQIPILLLVYYAGDVGDRGFSTVRQCHGRRAARSADPISDLRKHEDIEIDHHWRVDACGGTQVDLLPSCSLGPYCCNKPCRDSLIFRPSLRFLERMRWWSQPHTLEESGFTCVRAMAICERAPWDSFLQWRSGSRSSCPIAPWSRSTRMVHS